VDKWCLLGIFNTNAEGIHHERSGGMEFDLDVYKILRRYLSLPANVRNIKTVPLNHEGKPLFMEQYLGIV
jgi:hypothetical protein